jgi:hypothetical protein
MKLDKSMEFDQMMVRTQSRTRIAIFAARLIVLLAAASLSAYCAVSETQGIGLVSSPTWLGLSSIPLVLSWYSWRVLYYPFVQISPNLTKRHEKLDFKHSSHTLRLDFGERAVTIAELDEILQSLHGFAEFRGNHNKQILCRLSEGYIYFETLGIMGIFSGVINPREVPVRLWRDGGTRTVIGDTCTGHMLRGQRRWMVSATRTGNMIEIKTEARERAADRANWLGMCGPGKELQRRLWTHYLENIADRFQHATANQSNVPPCKGKPLPHRAPPAIEWTPREPYPGFA